MQKWEREHAKLEKERIMTAFDEDGCFEIANELDDEERARRAFETYKSDLLLAEIPPITEKEKTAFVDGYTQARIDMRLNREE